jgi:hypothetical protein
LATRSPAAGVDQHLTVGAGQRGHLVATRADAHHLLPHDLREADQLLDRLALHAQRGEERGDLCVGRGARHDGVHRRRRLQARQVATVHQPSYRFRDDG